MRRQAEAVERFARLEDTTIPDWVDFKGVMGLSTEVSERLMRGAAAVAGAGGADAGNHARGNLDPGGPYQEPARPQRPRDLSASVRRFT